MIDDLVFTQGEITEDLQYINFSDQLLFNGFYSEDKSIFHRPDAVIFQDNVLANSEKVNVIVVDKVTKVKAIQVKKDPVNQDPHQAFEESKELSLIDTVSPVTKKAAHAVNGD